MPCYLEFSVFWRQKIVACPIERTDFVLFLALNDFLNIAKSYLNTFLFGSFFLMHGWTLYHFDNKSLQNPN